MLMKKEIIGFLLVFITIYLILFIDHKLNACDECKTYKKVSLKVPLIFTLSLLTLYKLFYQNLSLYFNNFSIAKQNIITDMADF